jgi:hypothetical protein
MALSPLQPLNQRIIINGTPTQPTKTYGLDIDSGNVGGIIKGEPAIRQFIRKAILTARFRFLIYDDQYGCELSDLIGEDIPFELLETEIPRVITEALTADDRVQDVFNYELKRQGDELHVKFTVQLVDETLITEEVTV